MKNIAKHIYTALIFLFLYAPIATLMVLSFNASKTRAKQIGYFIIFFLHCSYTL